MPRTPQTATRYVAFLRGINVGGNRLIKMDALKAAFEKMKFRKVKTVLAAGNVLFESEDTDALALTRKIESGLEKSVGYPVGIVLRTIEQLERLVTSDPFKGVKVTPATRLWVTFLREKARGKTEITNVFELTSDLRKGMNVMAELDKEHGRGITTRSWSTIGKILKATRSS